MKSLEEYNNEKRKLYEYINSGKTGIACPHCGDEMLKTNPNVTLTSYPPQKEVHCPTCKYKTYIIA